MSHIGHLANFLGHCYEMFLGHFLLLFIYYTTIIAKRVFWVNQNNLGLKSVVFKQQRHLRLDWLYKCWELSWPMAEVGWGLQGFDC